MKINKKYPKTWEKYKSHLLSKYGGDKIIAAFITDETLELNMQSTPMSATFYFDDIGYIGCVSYEDLEERFIISVNGAMIPDPDIEHNEDLPFIGSKDRREAELLLIKYIFSEVEKTL